ncbi:MAG: hypothetical protein GX444_00940 [Myxococcales bacterium]|nr:hypothetical protein [Myxococcales bacterium]
MHRRILVLFLVLTSLGAGAAWAGENEPAPVPELTAFHLVMAKCWHTDYPAKDWAAIRQAAPELVMLAGALQKATLPAGLQSRKATFDSKALILVAEVGKLAQTAKGKDDAALSKALIDVHEAYHQLATALYKKEEPEHNECTKE